MEQALHLVVNWVCVDAQEITVGATDSERWRWDTEAGMSGADAKTIVWVTLTANQGSFSGLEHATIFCGKDEPARTLALAGVGKLLDIAWAIVHQSLTDTEAHTRYFAQKIFS